MNFIFISPNFPHTYWHFCDCLKRNGVNVLGIGDCPYDYLADELKASLTEYYKVDSMENYDSMYRAVAFFAFKYGRIDWLESNNEYWLEQDAKLRKDFNITTGVQPDELALWKSKSAMKPVYREAGIPTARNHKITDIEAARAFLEEIGGYPVIVKPDIGVGAEDTWKLENDQELEAFFNNKPGVPYVMEEFVFGNIYSYDAICDSKSQPLFESSCWFPPSVADMVNKGLEMTYYVNASVPEQLREYGRKALKAFKVRNRFVHFEFFRLTQPRHNLGEVGEFVGLEVNMRPAGGYTPDMINFGHSTDVYQMYADMVTKDTRLLPDPAEDKFCVYASKKDVHKYAHTHEEIMEKYGGRIVMAERMPDVLSGAMGNEMYTAIVNDEKDIWEFAEFVEKRAE